MSKQKERRKKERVMIEKERVGWRKKRVFKAKARRVGFSVSAEMQMTLHILRGLLGSCFILIGRHEM